MCCTFESEVKARPPAAEPFSLIHLQICSTLQTPPHFALGTHDQPTEPACTLPLKARMQEHVARLVIIDTFTAMTRS